MIILSSCSNEQKTDIATCKIITSKDSIYQAVFPLLLDHLPEDSIWQEDFLIKIVNDSRMLYDKKHEWSREFASHYDYLDLMSFSNKYVVLYAAHSGILNGYRLFRKWWHDIYILDRKDGHIVKLIEISEGLGSAAIYGNAVVMRFGDPDSLRICTLE